MLQDPDLSLSVSLKAKGKQSEVIRGEGVKSLLELMEACRSFGCGALWGKKGKVMQKGCKCFPQPFLKMSLHIFLFLQLFTCVFPPLGYNVCISV